VPAVGAIEEYGLRQHDRAACSLVENIRRDRFLPAA